MRCNHEQKKKAAWASVILGRPSVCLYTHLTLLCHPTVMLSQINDLAILSYSHIMHVTWVRNNLAEGSGTTGKWYGTTNNDAGSKHYRYRYVAMSSHEHLSFWPLQGRHCRWHYYYAPATSCSMCGGCHNSAVKCSKAPSITVSYLGPVRTHLHTCLMYAMFLAHGVSLTCPQILSNQ